MREAGSSTLEGAGRAETHKTGSHHKKPKSQNKQKPGHYGNRSEQENLPLQGRFDGRVLKFCSSKWQNHSWGSNGPKEWEECIVQ